MRVWTEWSPRSTNDIDYTSLWEKRWN